MLDITRWDPFQEMMSLRDAMNRLMEESFLLPSRVLGAAPETGQLVTRGTRMLGAPALDIVDQDDAFIVRASLPGVRPEDVHIEARGDQVTLRGHVKEEQEVERANYIIHERRAGQFSRTFTLPTEVNTEGAEATFENGILTLRLPKAEGVRPRQIPIRAQAGKPQLEQGQVQAPGQAEGQIPISGQAQGQPQSGQYAGQGQFSGQSQTPGQGQSYGQPQWTEQRPGQGGSQGQTQRPWQAGGQPEKPEQFGSKRQEPY
jgi:HSP20 family protein